MSQARTGGLDKMHGTAAYVFHGEPGESHS